MGNKRRLAILISGGGTTAEAVIKACQSDDLALEPAVVISSNPEARGLQKAQTLGIKTYVVSRNIQLGDELLHILRNEYIDIVSQNGWMPLTPKIVIEKYKGFIINQHPGPLDPGREVDFGGKGMYGARVVCARLAYIWITATDPWTESVTHFATDKFDQGKLISTIRMDVPFAGKKISIKDLESDQPTQKKLMSETKRVQQKLLPLEHQNVIESLRKLAGGNPVEGFTREKPLIPGKYRELVTPMKAIAISLFPNG